jgi:hypothetical protein
LFKFAHAHPHLTMILPQFADNPLKIQLSFHKIIERFEEIAASGEGADKQNAIDILAEIANYPELKEGITTIAQIENNEVIIAGLLAELFPAALTLNEIKAVSIPYQGLMFNYTERFKKILQAAGPSFEINIRNFDDHQFYIAGCCLILNRFYGTDVNFTRPFFYDIPTANGIIKHYRIMYNADFIDIIPTGKAPTLSPDDISHLLDNYDDVELWKEKFPAGSFILKGFALITLFDVTVDNAVSILKDNLLGNTKSKELKENLAVIFRSIYNIPDLRIGFTLINNSEGKLSNTAFGPNLHSYLLFDKQEDDGEDVLCKNSYRLLMKDHKYFAVSNMAVFMKNNAGSGVAKNFSAQDIQSFILAPVVKNDILLGILELVSSRPKELNSINAHKLEIVMPYLVDTIDRKITELQNRVQAVIQNNYTTLHPSVNWKFRREAQNYIQFANAGQEYQLKEIVFKTVYPLYGQVDIGNSSNTRNQSVKNDLLNQLNQLITLFEQLHQYKPIQTAEKNLKDLKAFIDDLSGGLKADTEPYIQDYLQTNIYPLLNDNYSEQLTSTIEQYLSNVDTLTGDFHLNRRNYDKTLMAINGKLAAILDKRQTEIQSYFPHYYERFKTDGVEHNLYIGGSIAPTLPFSPLHLHRLRLWQLLVTAEMEIEQQALKLLLPYQLGVTSLVLAFSTPIAIRFRMDEKHFDVDGAYNVRYEVIKKRIDKAYTLDTHERITQEGKITIIYSKNDEQDEYSGYIKILQTAGILKGEVEQFDIEDLQGVVGLKGMRVAVQYEPNVFRQEEFNYEKLYQQLS